MAAFSARATVLTPSGGKVTYGSGRAATLAEADNELSAKLQMIIGTVIGASIITITDPADYVTGGTTQQFEDLNLVLQKADGLGKIYKTVRINNVSLALKAAGLGTNKLDETNGAVLLFVNSFRDGNGVGGYSLDPGASTFDS